MGLIYPWSYYPNSQWVVSKVLVGWVTEGANLGHPETGVQKQTACSRRSHRAFQAIQQSVPLLSCSSHRAVSVAGLVGGDHCPSSSVMAGEARLLVQPRLRPREMRFQVPLSQVPWRVKYRPSTRVIMMMITSTPY